MESRIEYVSNIKRVVVKVGTSTLTYPNGLLNLSRIENLVRQIANLHNMGLQVVLVSSGAIGAGMGKLGLTKRPKTIPDKQAIAAIGQGVLLHMYEKFFSEYSQIVGQLLLTKDDMYENTRLQNIKNTFSNLLNKGIIPIVNENDAVITDEIKFGDNDTLSALVSKVSGADLLIILSDIDGLYDSNPNEHPDAKLISFVPEITAEIEAAAGGKGSELGTGGMTTKIHAAKIAHDSKIPMVIVNGSKENILEKVVTGETVGTWFNVK